MPDPESPDAPHPPATSSDEAIHHATPHPPKRGWQQYALTPAAFAIVLLAGLYVGWYVPPTWVVQERVLDTQVDDAGRAFTVARGNPVYLDDATEVAGKQEAMDGMAEALAEVELDDQADATTVQTVFIAQPDGPNQYFELRGTRHWGLWSLLPAGAAIGLCLITREPITALFGGVVSGAFLLRLYDLPGEVLMPTLATESVAEVVLLYGGLLGGLLGIWSRSGSARAFANWAARTFVRGPRSAKLVGWALGVTFFQGGTISTVMVGTTVRPLADRERVSHEELSYIVDSTASPIAAVLAFNAWPAYVQALIFVPGVVFLATEADRLAFFFSSVPLSFYGIFAVVGTFLMCIDKAPILGSRFRKAIKRARETGQLDAPGSSPLSAKELEEDSTPEGFVPTMWGFLVPLFLIISIALGTFFAQGSPEVVTAFAAAFVAAAAIALVRGMTLIQLVEGMAQGIKGVLVATIILIFAITLGNVSKDAGGGAYLVSLLGDTLPYWLLPLCLLLLTMIISFSTGTSWGTYAVAFPLGLPLAWAIAQGQGLEHEQLYMMVCFATILNGSLYGDQCSPISDTTVLSSMVSGADLMDHVRTQIVPATAAMTLAAICWTALAWFAA
ncbi:MAG: Na+/H+ antiporter NhaC family protein [Planctomycetota bacterium]